MFVVFVRKGKIKSRAQLSNGSMLLSNITDFFLLPPYKESSFIATLASRMYLMSILCSSKSRYLDGFSEKLAKGKTVGNVVLYFKFNLVGNTDKEFILSPTKPAN